MLNLLVCIMDLYKVRTYIKKNNTTVSKLRQELIVCITHTVMCWGILVILLPYSSLLKTKNFDDNLIYKQ